MLTLDTIGIHTPGFKRYVIKYQPAPIEWKIKPWFKIDLERLREWYKKLEKDHLDCKFVYGDNLDVWTDPIHDPTGRTGHLISYNSAWYVLSFCGNQEGALPPVCTGVKDEYKEEWDDNDELNPRKCFYGYGLDIIKSMPARVKKVQLTIMSPGHELILHQDCPDNLRFHIALETNNHCWWEIAGERIHIPADGWIYIVNTSLPHRVYNKGDTDRIHLYGKVSTKDIFDAEQFS